MPTTFFTVTKFQPAAVNGAAKVFSGALIWTVIFPIILLHMWVWLYQTIYFSVHGIPKASLRDYLTFDRNYLKKLSVFQKISCSYCAYANAVIAWAKTIINRTEAYSCAIKHRTANPVFSYQKEYYEYEEFQ